MGIAIILTQYIKAVFDRTSRQFADFVCKLSRARETKFFFKALVNTI